MELAWTHTVLRRNDDGISKQALQWTPQGSWKIFGERNVDSRFQIIAVGRWRRQS